MTPELVESMKAIMTDAIDEATKQIIDSQVYSQVSLAHDGLQHLITERARQLLERDPELNGILRRRLISILAQDNVQ